MAGWADQFEKAVMIKKPLVKLVFAIGKLPLDKIKRGDDCVVQCGSVGILPIIPCGKMLSRRRPDVEERSGGSDHLVAAQIAKGCFCDHLILRLPYAKDQSRCCTDDRARPYLP